VNSPGRSQIRIDFEFDGREFVITVFQRHLGFKRAIALLAVC
jgi:hypothetical protein